MASKLKIILLLALTPWFFLPAQGPESDLIKLDLKGKRGVVNFNHRAHVAAKPDPHSPHQADGNATCAGCHHTRGAFGVPQLWRCGDCHLGEGNEQNPKSRDFDEMYLEKAFHTKCIECHQASEKGPKACNDCHRTPGHPSN